MSPGDFIERKMERKLEGGKQQTYFLDGQARRVKGALGEKGVR